jgi:hypothetical protein
MRTNAVGAFNGYIWPGSPGTVGQQLTLGAGNSLIWSDSDGIPWTTKGQLVVGTGVGTDILLNAGSNTAVLMADSFTGSGLTYSNSVTSAMLAPAGNTLQRPNPATPGQIRYNTLTGKFEFATGATSWEQIASGNPAVSTFVSQSVPSAPAGATGNVLVPAGSNAQRQTSPAPVDGSMRYNTDTDELEVFGPLGWKTIPSSVSGTFVQQTAPTVGTPSAVIPAGNGTQQQTTPAPLAGYLRFNTTTLLLEVFDGFAWTPAGAPPTAGLGIDITGSLVKVAIPTASAPPAAGPGATQAVVGSMYWDDVLNQLFIYYSNGGSPVWVQAAPSVSSGGGGGTAIVFPSNPAAQSPTNTFSPTSVPANTYNSYTYTWNGTAWTSSAAGGGGGTVTGVTASLPLVSSGGAAPNLTINAATAGALGAVQIGTNLQVTGGGTVSILDASDTQKGVVEMATAAEAAAGTNATLAAPVAYSVPKDAANMTGAAILPSGTDLERAAIATPTIGMQRYNTTSGYEEVYTGATTSWKKFDYVVDPSPALPDLTLSGATTLDSTYACKNLTVSAGATLTSDGTGVVIRAQGDVTINASTWTLLGINPSFTLVGVSSPINYQGAPGLGYGGGSVTAGGRPYSPYAQIGGSSGGTATAGVGSIFSNAGRGGGYIVIIAGGNITFNGTVTMTCAGQVGSTSDGGPGGGSGGTIIIQTPLTLTTPATVTFDVRGGNGGPSVNGGGGGGGGGGWVILEAGTLVDSSSKLLAGGSGGSSGGPGNAGAGGAANAGAGGSCPGSSGPGTAGGTGTFLTYGSPF